MFPTSTTANDDSAGLARRWPNVLLNKITFAFPDHHRLRNDLQTAATTEAGRCRPFYFVHTHRLLRNTSLAFAMEVHFWGARVSSGLSRVRTNHVPPGFNASSLMPSKHRSSLSPQSQNPLPLFLIILPTSNTL
ncbi:hypothetical protein V8F06_014627, partial [Rhypophila decipiens]